MATSMRVHGEFKHTWLPRIRSESNGVYFCILCVRQSKIIFKRFAQNFFEGCLYNLRPDRMKSALPKFQNKTTMINAEVLNAVVGLSARLRFGLFGFRNFSII